MYENRETPQVLFQEEGGISRTYAQKPSGGLVGLIMRISGGRITNPRDANYLLMGIAFAAILLTLIIFAANKAETEYVDPITGATKPLK